MSGYLGGERPYEAGFFERDLTVLAVYVYDMERGHCFHLKDSNGHRLVWFTRRKRPYGPGDSLRARFMVRRHQEYCGQQENIVKRFSVIRTYNAGQRLNTGNPAKKG